MTLAKKGEEKQQESEEGRRPSVQGITAKSEAVTVYKDDVSLSRLAISL